MEGWRIAVLCTMIAVFVIAVVALLWFFWVTRVQVKFLREPSSHIFHFYDFSNPRQLVSLDLTQWEGKPLPQSVSSAQSGAVVNVPPLNLSNGIAPAGGVYDLYRKDHFLLALAQRIGDPDPSTLAVSRLDPGNVLVELDLGDFLCKAKRDGHMESTAIVPCVLTRHFAFDRDFHFDQSSPLYNFRGTGSAFAATSRYPSRVDSGRTSRNISVVHPANPHHHADPLGGLGGMYPSAANTPRSVSSRNGMNHTATTAAYANYEMGSGTGVAVLGGSGERNDEGMPLPAPLILPISPNITINTPITLSSALYVYEDNEGREEGQKRGGPLANNGSVLPYGRGVNGVDEVPTAMSERLEQLIMHDRANGTFTVAPNAIATVNVKQQSATIKYTNGTPSRRVQRCVTGLPISYYYEGPDQLLSYKPNTPIYLPAGRWSLCAQVHNEFGTDFRTQSRVFTVEVGR